MAKRPWQWSLAKKRACEMLAGGATVADVAARLKADGLKGSARSIETWKKHPEFAAELKHTAKAVTEEVLLDDRARTVATRVGRIRELDDQLMDMHRLRERNAHLANGEEGAETGYLIRVVKTKEVKGGRETTVYYRTDAGLAATIRQIVEAGRREDLGDDDAGTKKVKIVIAH